MKLPALIRLRGLTSLRGTAAILYKEVIHLRRDPLTLIVMFAIPAFQLLIFGYTVDMQVRNVPTIVWDRDQTSESRKFTALLDATSTLRTNPPDTDEPIDSAFFEHEMKAGRAMVMVEIPPGFAAKLQAGRRAEVQVRIDGSNSTVATQALGAIEGVGFNWNIATLQATAPPGRRVPLVVVKPTTRFNPDMRSANFFVPGLLGIIMQVVTVFLTAASIVREREKGTLEQLMVTPVSRGALMIGKLLPYAVIGFVETALVVLIMVAVFEVPINGDVFLLAGLSLCFLFPALGLGILISTFARNSLQAMFGAMMTMLPSIMLSGFIFPRESMPWLMNFLGWTVPVTYYIEILRGIILRSAGLAELYDEAIILVMFGVFFLTVAAGRFQKRIA
ncbi:MAG: ABC transporter permease [Planctomycetota bacterium]